MVNVEMDGLDNLSNGGIRRSNIPRRYNTIGHLILDLETELGATDSDYATLDDIIDEAKDRLVAKAQYNREEAVTILRTIGQIINKKLPKYEQSGIDLFSQGFKSNSRNCFTSTLIYLSIAEEFPLPLAGVRVPTHMFVRWAEEEKSFNWETSTLFVESEEGYKSRLNVSDKSIDSNVFMTNLTREETIAECGYGLRAMAWDKNGQYERAFEDSNTAIELYSNSVIAHNSRGHARHSLGDIDGAIEDFNRAIELSPNEFEAYHNRGNVLHMKGNVTRAKEDFNRAIELSPNNDISYYSRGYAFCLEGDYDHGLEDFDIAIRLNPKNQRAYFYRGVVMKMKDNPDEAIRDFNIASELDPNDPNVYRYRGATFLDMGRVNRAIKDFNRAMNLDPNNPDDYNARGMAYEKKGDMAKANADFLKADTLNK